MANLLTFARVLLIFVVIAVWARESYVQWWWLDLLMVPVLAWAIFMDALDGWVARRRQEATEAGALFDIAGDRIVELALWVFFAIRETGAGTPLLPYWVPLVMIARTVLTDLVRSIAFREGRTPFGERTMLESGWAKQLVSSRWSRATYGVLKSVAFCALGSVIAWQSAGGGPGLAALRLTADVLVYATVLFSVVRAVPVLWDGRKYLATTPTPR